MLTAAVIFTVENYKSIIAFSEFESIGEDAVVAYLKLLSHCLPRGSEGNQERL
jgi:hypothetical protein